MNDVSDFLDAVLPLQRGAEHALVNGDAAPRKALWSDRAPVTILGAGRDSLTVEHVFDVFDRLAEMVTSGEAELEVVAAEASGDLGYIVGYERITASIAGDPQPTFELRVTLVFRREDGQWKAVHRHADPRTNAQPGVERARDLLNQ